MKGLFVEHCGDLLIVTVPGTDFIGTFHKPDGGRILKLLTVTADLAADRQAKFLFRADAYIAAMNKARELGWIG